MNIVLTIINYHKKLKTTTNENTKKHRMGISIMVCILYLFNNYFKYYLDMKNLTPQEKAFQLCNKFSWEETKDGFKMFQTLDETKRCALIAVDEILNQFTWKPSTGMSYWEEVKIEIQKL